MDAENQQHLTWVRTLCDDVASSLSAIERGQSPGRLIFPLYRAGGGRVSEQESKILIAQWLQNEGRYYSVETPTISGYQQSGLRSLSARLDLTVYGSRHPADRVLNIELKAHLPGANSFSKDIEKLLVEDRPGLWFHTLVTERMGIWAALEDRVRVSLEAKLPLIKQPHQHLIYFAFCVLHPPRLVFFHLDVSADWATKLSREMDLELNLPPDPAFPSLLTVAPSSGATSAIAVHGGAEPPI